MKNVLIILLSSILFWSCEETVLLDLNQADPRLIVEGQVTNQPGFQFVKLTRSVGFYDTGDSPGVTDASVLVRDNLGNEIVFLHKPGNAGDSAGFYLPPTSFVGVVGRRYTLHITADGEVYEASDDLQPVTPIDSLTYRVNEDEQEDPEVSGKFYEVLFYAKEPQDRVDYYLLKYYRNDSLTVDFDTDIYYADDEVLGENIDGLASPVYYAPGDTARVEMYSLTRTGFVFYNDLQSLLNSDGGLFSQPPSNSRTNLSNGALGFFQASAMDWKEIIIK